MMTRVVALHGSTGSGKSTLSRVIEEHLGAKCLVIQENIDELLPTSNTGDNQAPWYHRTTAISASDNVTNILMGYISPFSVLIFTLIVYLFMGTVWLVVLLFVGCFAISRLCRWLNSHILSKMWLYNVFLFNHREKTSSCQWVWRDRTCIDVYAYCLLNKATAVPLNMGSILLEQTRTTSVAIILDVPQHIIEKHLRKRVRAPTTSWSFAVVTQLILLIQLPITASIAALKLVERWYTKMNVPVIKISELRDQLDSDETIGDIHWNERSINILLGTIERAIVQREPPSSTIDELLMPWQIERNSRLFHI